MDIMINSASRRVNMLILYLVMMLTTWELLDVYVPSEIASVDEDPLVDSSVPILDEGPISWI